jgi:hypothetical protein
VVSYRRTNSGLIFPFPRHEDVEGEKRYSSSYSVGPGGGGVVNCTLRTFLEWTLQPGWKFWKNERSLNPAFNQKTGLSTPQPTHCTDYFISVPADFFLSVIRNHVMKTHERVELRLHVFLVCAG